MITVPINGSSPLGENMRNAMGMVTGGGRLIDAARRYGIPISTLVKYLKDPSMLQRSRLYYCKQEEA